MRYIVIFIYMTSSGHGRILFCYFFATTITACKREKVSRTRSALSVAAESYSNSKIIRGAVIDKLNSF